MELPIDTSNLTFIANKPAEHDGDGWHQQVTVICAGQVPGTVTLILDADPGVDPGSEIKTERAVTSPKKLWATVTKPMAMGRMREATGD